VIARETPARLGVVLPVAQGPSYDVATESARSIRTEREEPARMFGRYLVG